MDHLSILRKTANELLRDSSNKSDRRKFEIIKDFLGDDDCFLNIDIEHAYAILRDLGIDEESINSYYLSLIAR